METSDGTIALTEVEVGGHSHVMVGAAGAHGLGDVSPEEVERALASLRRRS